MFRSTCAHDATAHTAPGRTACILEPEGSAKEAVSPGLLSAVLSHLNREVPLEESARRVLPLIAEALAVDTVALLRATSDNEAEVTAAFGPTRKRGFPYARVNLADPALASLTRGPAVVTLDISSRAFQPALRALCHPRVGLAFGASAFIGHSIGGLLVLSRRRREELSADQSDRLAAVSDAVGLALGVASLSRQSHLSEVVLETACAVARAVSGSLDLSLTFRQIAASAARLMGNSSCLLLELDAATDDLVAVACSDPGDEALLGLQVRFEDEEGNRGALAERRSIVVDDLVWGAGAERAYRERLNIRSALFVPIHAERGLIGSLLLYSTGRRDRYSARDVARAETVAELAASAISNARLYRDLQRSESRATDLLRRITRLRDQQRLAFASALHDDIVQMIVAAFYEVESLRGETSSQAEPALERIAGLLKNGIAELRRVIWDLRPPVLDGLGLNGALRALAERVGNDGGLEVLVDLDEVPGLSPSTSAALYVIAREALQNARRHSGATRVYMTLKLIGESSAAVRLRVHDDGVGVDEQWVEAEDHYGLTMMDEQAALVGGTLSVGNHPQGGTLVEVTVPSRQGTDDG